MDVQRNILALSLCDFQVSEHCSFCFLLLYCLLRFKEQLDFLGGVYHLGTASPKTPLGGKLPSHHCGPVGESGIY